MKKWLLPEHGNFYKANLHCHTNISDGQFSPEELKQFYMEQGYSIVAYTDHEILVPHNDLAEENFLPLNGYEYSVKPVNFNKQRKACHIGLIALKPEGIMQVCWGGDAWGENIPLHLDEALFDKNAPLYPTEYSSKCVSDIMQTAQANGFYVIYNHPAWSQEDLFDIIDYHGMHAMEIYNYGSIMLGYDEYNPKLFEDMLRRGKRINCIAADDNHSAIDHFGGWTMICAEQLEYLAISKALIDGHFYASSGPQIHALWFEDGMVHIECSPAAEIQANYGVRKACRIKATDTPLTQASFPVQADDNYIRLTIIDAKGGHANTNPYYVDELFAE